MRNYDVFYNMISCKLAFFSFKKRLEVAARCVVINGILWLGKPQHNDDFLASQCSPPFGRAGGGSPIGARVGIEYSFTKAF